VPSFVGVMLRTPGLRCYAILCVAFPLVAFINQMGRYMTHQGSSQFVMKKKLVIFF